jgi:hypothetical protein
MCTCEASISFKIVSNNKTGLYNIPGVNCFEKLNVSFTIVKVIMRFTRIRILRSTLTDLCPL